MSFHTWRCDPGPIRELLVRWGEDRCPRILSWCLGNEDSVETITVQSEAIKRPPPYDFRPSEASKLETLVLLVLLSLLTLSYRGPGTLPRHYVKVNLTNEVVFEASKQ